MADLDHRTLDHPSGNATVAAHGVVAPRAQVLLHARAGVTQAVALQKGLADAKAAVLKDQEVEEVDPDFRTAASVYSTL